MQDWTKRLFRVLAMSTVGLTMAAAWPAGCQQKVYDRVSNVVCPDCPDCLIVDPFDDDD